MVLHRSGGAALLHDPAFGRRLGPPRRHPALQPGGSGRSTGGSRRAVDRLWTRDARRHRAGRPHLAVEAPTDVLAARGRGPDRSHVRHTSMTAPATISFVVPCFNEEDNVGPTVETIRAVMAAETHYEIIPVDDRRTDATLPRMKALAEADPRIRVVSNPVNLGLGGSYKRGVEVAQGTHVIMLPGDNGFPADSVAEILRQAGRADIVIPVVSNPGAR